MAQNTALKKSQNRLSAFTLIELSISLVIIGLIVGGILGARDLIRQAEIRSIITQVQNFKSIVNTFDLKYSAIPGDMLIATSYWSGVSNGNGDGLIADWDDEGVDFWQHLAMAGLLPGSYTGVDAGTPDVQLDVNIPSASLDGAGYQAHHVGSNSNGFGTGTDAIYGRRGNVILLGTHDSSNNFMLGGVLFAAEAKALDEKMDDGEADEGQVFGIAPDTLTQCTGVIDTAASGSYVLSDTTGKCRMVFWLDK